MIGHGTRRENLMYLIDLSSAKRYINPQNGQHISKKLTKRQIGNPLFSSIHATINQAQSRRDDLESLGYVLAFFLNEGKLPWITSAKESLKTNNHLETLQKMHEVARSKNSSAAINLFPESENQKHFA